MNHSKTKNHFLMKTTFECAQPFEPPSIAVFICGPNEKIRKAKIRVNEPIASLQTLFPGSPRQFLYHGQILDDDQTVDAYAMADSDIVMAVPLEFVKNCSRSKWLKISEDTTQLSEKLLASSNPSTASEWARLEDLKFIRMSNRSRGQKQIMKRVAIIQNIHGSSLQTQTVIPSQVMEPSVEPIPFVWD